KISANKSPLKPKVICLFLNRDIMFFSWKILVLMIFHLWKITLGNLRHTVLFNPFYIKVLTELKLRNPCGSQSKMRGKEKPIFLERESGNGAPKVIWTSVPLKNSTNFLVN